MDPRKIIGNWKKEYCCGDIINKWEEEKNVGLGKMKGWEIRKKKRICER